MSTNTNQALGTYHRGYLVINRFPAWMSKPKRNRLRAAMCGTASDAVIFAEARVMLLLDPLAVSVDYSFHEPLKELHLRRDNALFDVDVIAVDVAFAGIKGVTSYKNIRFERTFGDIYQIVTGSGHEVEIDTKIDHYQSLINEANRI